MKSVKGKQNIPCTLENGAEEREQDKTNRACFSLNTQRKFLPAGQETGVKQQAI